VLVPARRDVRPAKSSATGYRNQIGVGPNLRLHIQVDLANIAAVIHVFSVGADRDNTMSVGNAATRVSSQSDIPGAGGIVSCRL
jgi:hypothetical protein